MADEKAENTKKKKKSTVKTKKKAPSNKPITKPLYGLPSSKLKVRMVDSGRVTGVCLEHRGDINFDKNDTVELDNSWAELCRLLLGMVYNVHPNDFLKVLLEKRVIQSGFDVTAEERKYLEDDPIFKTFKVPNTDFYFISDFNGKAIVNVIKGTLSILNIDEKDLQLDIIPTSKVQSTVKLSTNTEKIKIGELVGIDSNKVKVTSINIMGTALMVKNIYKSAVKFINFALELYGESALKSAMVCNKDTIGICDSAEMNCERVESIKGTKLYIYNKDESEIIEYIIELCRKLGLSEELVEIGISKK